LTCASARDTIVPHEHRSETGSIGHRAHHACAVIAAADELEDDELDIIDLESIVLTGEIIERQKDQTTGEAKYVIRGITLANAAGCVVAKFDSVGRAVIITVYLE
jgi:hypothetical protein